MRDILLQNANAILLQNTTEVYLQNVSSFLLLNATVYYKMRQLLQIATILLQNATVITKFDVYCKLRLYIIYFEYVNFLM